MLCLKNLASTMVSIFMLVSAYRAQFDVVLACLFGSSCHKMPNQPSCPLCGAGLSRLSDKATRDCSVTLSPLGPTTPIWDPTRLWIHKQKEIARPQIDQQNHIKNYTKTKYQSKLIWNVAHFMIFPLHETYWNTLRGKKIIKRHAHFMILLLHET